MTTNNGVFTLLDAVIEQTLQRGGCPGLESVFKAKLDVQAFVDAYAAVRTAALETGGEGEAMYMAIGRADYTLAVLKGEE